MRKILLAVLVLVIFFGVDGFAQVNDQEFDPSSGIDPDTGCKLWTVVGGPRRVSDDKPTTTEKLLEKYVLMKDLIVGMGYDFDLVYDRAQKGIGIEMIEYTAAEAPIYKRSTYSIDQKTPMLTSGCVKPAWEGKQPLWHQTFSDLPMPLPALDTYINCSNTSASGELREIRLTLEYKLNIEKMGLNLTANETQFKEDTPANPENHLRFEVKFSSAGSNTDQHNVTVRDVLPSRLRFIPKSLLLEGRSVSATDENAFFEKGINIGTLPQGEERTIFFDALVAGATEFRDVASFTEVVRAVLTNRAYVKSDEIQEIENTAVVTVFVPQLVTQLRLTKGVQSLRGRQSTTFSESIRATIEERLRYQSILDAKGSNVGQRPRVRDSLDKRIIYRERTLMIGGRQATREQEIQFFQNGIELPEIPPNTAVTIVYEAEVTRSSEFQVDIDTILENQVFAQTDRFRLDDRASVLVRVVAEKVPEKGPPSKITRKIAIPVAIGAALLLGFKFKPGGKVQAALPEPPKPDFTPPVNTGRP